MTEFLGHSTIICILRFENSQKHSVVLYIVDMYLSCQKTSSRSRADSSQPSSGQRQIIEGGFFPSSPYTRLLTIVRLVVRCFILLILSRHCSFTGLLNTCHSTITAHSDNYYKVATNVLYASRLATIAFCIQLMVKYPSIVTILERFALTLRPIPREIHPSD